jgi:outer membrane protein assembly factor BamB
LSFREISTIAVLDLEQAEIVWAARGVWHFQHDPDLLENGNILLFDNQGDWSRGGLSRVLELDPETMEIVWRYPTRAKGALSSSYRSEQQLLPNGNVLINEFRTGRLLEVNKAGICAG